MLLHFLYQVKQFHHFHCVEVFFIDDGWSCTLSYTDMRQLPSHLASLPAAGRRYQLAGCVPVSSDQSLVWGAYHKGKKWLQKQVLGQTVEARGLLVDDFILVDCTVGNIHINTEVHNFYSMNTSQGTH